MFKTKIREREGKCFPFLFFFQKTSGEKKRAVSWPFLKALQATANACSSVFQNMLFFWRLQDAEETGPCLGLFHKHIMHSSSCLHWEPFPFFSSRIAADLLCSPCPAPTLSPLPSEGTGQHAALCSSTQQHKGKAHFPPPSAASFPAAPAQPSPYHRNPCLAASSHRSFLQNPPFQAHVSQGQKTFIDFDFQAQNLTHRTRAADHLLQRKLPWFQAPTPPAELFSCSPSPHRIYPASAAGCLLLAGKWQ